MHTPKNHLLKLKSKVQIGVLLFFIFISLITFVKSKKKLTNMVYLDNAATTPLDSEVKKAMIEAMDWVGNPSSPHALGRFTRVKIEAARKSIAKIINASPSEIFFTSGGTESNNTVFWGAIHDLKINRIITTRLEHHAVLHTAEMWYARAFCNIDYVEVDAYGVPQKEHLEHLLATNKDEKILVSLMHANNEIGSMIDIYDYAAVCKKYKAYFHTDAVQTMGYYPIDVLDKNIDFLTCSAHKFHGPKGIGFLYINADVRIFPLINGGSQERNMRGGTENLYGIIGLAKALEIATHDMHHQKNYISHLKNYMVEQLKKYFPESGINGCIGNNGLYRVLSIHFPKFYGDEMLLQNLDMAGICVSGGSACSSGSQMGSHVINALPKKTYNIVRCSFSKYNTVDEIDTTIKALLKIIKNK